MKPMGDQRVRIVQFILVTIGLVLAGIALAADWLGIGGYPGLGPSQIVLAIIGLGMLLAGRAVPDGRLRQRARKLVLSKAALVWGGTVAGLLLVELGLRIGMATAPRVKDSEARRLVG